MDTKLKKQDISKHRTRVVKAFKEEGLNNQQIADILNVTRESIRKLLMKRSIKRLELKD